MFVLSHSRLHSRAPLTRAADASFDRFFGNAVAAATPRSPALDVSETDAAYLVTFDMPGVVREQIRVSVEGRRVNIETVDLPAEPARSEGDRNTLAEQPAGAVATDAIATGAKPPRALYRERNVARYVRSVVLPAEVDQSVSQAKLENGVLTLTLAKKVASGATLLNVA